MWLVGSLIVGWAFADFLSGFWHWLEDRYFRAEWPLIGKHIAIPNQIHHERPAAFLDNTYWGRNWTTIVPAMVVFFVAFSLGAPFWMLFGLLAASQANEIHAWTHQKCSPLIRMVQNTGFLQSCKMHGQHHKAPFDCRYCVITEWLNPPLDYFGFWSGLEWVIYRVTGVKAGDNA